MERPEINGSQEQLILEQDRTPKHNLTKVLSLFVASNAVTLLFTVIPVIFSFPSIYRNGWYVGDDIIRLLEPMITLPLTFWILWESPICQKPNRDTLWTLLLFMFFSSIYQQGAGFHSAANMFKHAVEGFNEKHPDLVTQYPELFDIYSWIRDTWQHIIAHYMYAVGGILVSFVHAYSFRNYAVNSFSSFGRHNHSSSALSDIQKIPFHAFQKKKDVVLFYVAIVLYGLIVGSVAIEFPKGSILAFLLTIVYGFGILGIYTWKKSSNKMEGRLLIGFYPILHYFIGSYLVGFLIVLGWTVKHGLKNREESGIKF